MITILALLTAIWLVIGIWMLTVRRRQKRMENLSPLQRVIALSVRRANGKSEYFGYDK